MMIKRKLRIKIYIYIYMKNKIKTKLKMNDYHLLFDAANSKCIIN